MTMLLSSFSSSSSIPCLYTSTFMLLISSASCLHQKWDSNLIRQDLEHDNRNHGPRFLGFFTEKQLNPGESVSLKCMSTGIPLPQITWKLDGFPLDNSRNLRTGDYVTNDNYVISFVNITSVTTHNGGSYTCTAASEAGSIDNSANLYVMGPPFVRPMDNLTTVASSQLVIKCPVGGHPISHMFWAKDGKKLPSNHRQTVHPNGTLVIREIAKESDEGFYSCTAMNEQGLQSSNGFRLSVQVAPKIDPFHLYGGVQVGDRLSITCTVIKGDSPFTIEWWKDGVAITNDDHQDTSLSIHHLAEYSSTLLFKVVRSEHRGNYTCIAGNSVGQDSHTQSLIIHAPPQWTYEPVDTSATKGQQVWVNCQASGSPHPSIVWKRLNNSTMSYKTLVSSFRIQTLDNGSLFINDIQPLDVGSYLCQASNGIGTELSKVIHISVHEGANFRNRYQSVELGKTDDARLSCEAFGERPISIHWQKNNKPIILDPKRIILSERFTGEGILSELEIISVERKDSAIYTCQASNGYGRDEHTIQLIVRDVPDPPENLRITNITSRSVAISWSAPFSGNSPIVRYHIYLREMQDISHVGMQIRNITAPKGASSWIITELVPYTNYSISLTCVNEIGESDSSSVMRIQTDEEAPNEPPQHIKAYAISSQSIKVTWNAPESHATYGRTSGFYVGYRPLHARDAFQFKTLVLDGEKSFSKTETVLSDLMRRTKYEIVAQTFNSKGTGTLSEPIVVETFHEDPPRPPRIHSTSSSYASISLEWLLDSEDEQISGFVIKASSSKGDVIERRVHFTHRNFTLQGLFCGTLYEITIAASNSAGRGNPSDTLQVRTTGSVPIAPMKESFIGFVNATSIEVDLTAWRSGGCAIKYFSIKYKMKSEEMWTEVSNKIAASKASIWMDGLHPQTWYHLKSAAYSDAGTTDAIYGLMTTSFADQGMRNLAPLTYTKAYYQVFLEMEIILPLLLSFIVVVAVIILVCIMMNKRVPEQSLYIASSDLSKTSQANKKTNHMSFDKSDPTRTKLIMKPDQSLVNYPSPYATVQVTDGHSANTLKANHLTMEQQRFVEDTPYATVKRTPRHVKQCDRNIYDYPVPITMNATQPVLFKE